MENKISPKKYTFYGLENSLYHSRLLDEHPYIP